jgi:hypothetical protein
MFAIIAVPNRSTKNANATKSRHDMLPSLSARLLRRIRCQAVNLLNQSAAAPEWSPPANALALCGMGPTLAIATLGPVPFNGHCCLNDASKNQSAAGRLAIAFAGIGRPIALRHWLEDQQDPPLNLGNAGCGGG